MTTFPYKKICFNLVSPLPQRTKDILVRRFGFEDSECQTLEAIGQSHGITRERVRQLVEDGLRQVRVQAEKGSMREKIKEIFQHFSDTLKSAGHLKREDLLLEALKARDSANQAIFFLTLGDQFYGQKETEHFYPFWANKKEIYENTPVLLNGLLEYLEERKQPLHLDDLIKDYGKRYANELEAKVAPHSLSSVLEVSKHLARGYNEQWGLRSWPEVYPKGMRDKAYVVLKNTAKPLHFTEVARAIGELQDALVEQKKKNVLPQTVHNELIKDPRFVLVGRGTYALAEWGYNPGTVKEVIRHILQEIGVPLTKEEVIAKTLQQRRVKESTISLNLQDHKFFLRTPEGKYYI